MCNTMLFSQFCNTLEIVFPAYTPPYAAVACEFQH